ncbi:MAG: hypothetical protein PHU42_00140 [Patescibacteria group bacterium]|nr:hypothetical protein [Patescibacteria group bacterium]
MADFNNESVEAQREPFEYLIKNTTGWWRVFGKAGLFIQQHDKTLMWVAAAIGFLIAIIQSIIHH